MCHLTQICSGVTEELLLMKLSALFSILQITFLESLPQISVITETSAVVKPSVSSSV